LSSHLLSKYVTIRIYNIIILPVVLYGCETPVSDIKGRLRVSENRALRRIFGPNKDDATGDWRKLHNEELNYLDSSSSIIRMFKSRRMRWTVYIARMDEEEYI
jgi:hypothetical protein